MEQNGFANLVRVADLRLLLLQYDSVLAVKSAHSQCVAGQTQFLEQYHSATQRWQQIAVHPWG